MSDTTFPSLKNLGDPERLACSMAIGVDTKYLAERVGFEQTPLLKTRKLLSFQCKEGKEGKE